ncbi:MAG: dienelactone hydrolase family protein [Actinomycetota bacterium]|jgi:putative phosphoribosyl transferase|nr:dienelactone hydrolase family protein [Actinomycetota bacterium]
MQMVIDRLTVPLERAPLEGYLALREAAPGLVIVANGAGDSGNGTRNHRLLAGLHAIGFSALLIELLTERERRDRRRRSDVALLSRRLAATQHWTQTRVAAARHHVALLGIGPGAAAALVTAAAFPTDVAAVISLSGRPDLAGGSLRAVTAPTLLIVGGLDHALVSRNFDARQHLECPSRLLVISAATHHFDEPGCLEGALSATGSWLDNYVRPPQRAS